MESIHWYRAIPEAPHPEAGSKSAKGALPVKALQYCEPVCTASAWGWYVRSVHDLTVEWDGDVTYRWRFDGDGYEGTLDGLTCEGIQYPDFADLFNEMAPDRCRGYVPPWVVALQEPGMLQVWTGWFVRTPPEWSSLVRPVVNRPRPVGYQLFEGIIETDRWFGPLFTNLRLTQSHTPVVISARYPLLQLQMIPRAAYTKPRDEAAEIVIPAIDPRLSTLRTLDSKDPTTGWDAEAWNAYYDTVVVPRQRRGEYAIHARQRG